LIQIILAAGGLTYQSLPDPHHAMCAMTKPLPDKAEVALEYPDKLYIGTFERPARFDAHLDGTGIALVLERLGDAEARKSVHMHFHYALFADMLNDLAKAVSATLPADTAHRDELRQAAKALADALTGAAKADDKGGGTGDQGKLAAQGGDGDPPMTPDEEVLLLHVME
jgi:hypothetical protein